MLNKLNLLRNEIDNLDLKLLKILSKRFELVKKIGAIKNKYGLPLYDPKREKDIINLKKKEAKKIGISANFIEKIFYRIINQSYSYEKIKIFKKIKPNFLKILIISYNKNISILFKEMLAITGYDVFYIEEKKININKINYLFKKIGMIILDVSKTFFEKLIKKLVFLPKNCILIDLSPIKKIFMTKILKIYKGPVLGLYFLFNYKKNLLFKESIIYCYGRKEKHYIWFLKQIEIWGLKIKNMNIIEHDKYIFFIESLKYLHTLMYSIFLLKTKISLNKIFILSKPVFKLNSLIVKNFFSTNPQLYFYLIKYSKNNTQKIKKYLDYINNLVILVNKEKKIKIIDIFKKIKKLLVTNKEFLF
ncbi:bifunctional chorismate mutase/prephenate dehydrogenase [Enterobacteriaceae endosymbiont of Donacia bicoloricornis]|uniref:bifunctional chorismate mutase/prephenate dehydrogenase n=1 Tax=Enterobacteriaceae endosymbiont of Donacia bicoloricornis TaxID=2675772 RepID=UPI00144A09A0|nr:bifunctional chorismate mutase/prephenate dehydrogenase [Enterobacteriaceae endosymbiont of Donacia bicoloricornis]QJC37887.1 bifunctional chorismate mutase/prephenate dehydrogenase [Enterobacteriaceae endosymbiont of Donacia bicoloricornis]